MDTRLIAYITLAFVLFLIYQTWSEDYAPKPLVSETATEPADVVPPPAEDLSPVAESGQIPPAPGATPQAPVASNVAEHRSEQLISIETDVLKLTVDLFGGTVVSSELLDYPIDLEHPDEPIKIFSLSDPYYVARSGLKSVDGPAPDGEALYQSSTRQYRLGEFADELRVPLSWSKDGIDVVKTLIFKRGAYDIEIQHEIINNSNAAWQGWQYRELQRTYSDEGESRFIYTYTGGVIYSPEKKYEKIDFEEMVDDPLDRTHATGWLAMIQHYFLSAWVPESEEKNRYYSYGSQSITGMRYVLGATSTLSSVEQGASKTFSSILYVGPKIQDDLEVIATGLNLTVDYGYLTILAQPLFALLQFIHGLVGNWGWAIIIVTILIKLVFYKLAETSYRSMANMRKVQPKMVALKERYADDRQRLSQAMMELYKKEKINPLGGCLPMVIQIPVFIALYWVLLESVELRQADFMLWINDLSVKDPYFILPLIMGVSMYIQQKLNPAPIDPVQAKVFMTLPFVFTVFFAFFPSGLVLYWVVNNVLTIAQQWFITKKVLANT